MRSVSMVKPTASKRRRPRAKPRVSRVMARHAAAAFGFTLLGIAGWQAWSEGLFDHGTDHAMMRLVEISAKLGFAVDDIVVHGRHETSPEALLAALGLAHGAPMLGFDAAAAHERLKALPWIRHAMIERRLPDVVALQIVERRPIALWQKDGVFSLIDAEGAAIPIDDIARFNRLPVVVGAGAAPHAKHLIDILASEPELASRVRWAVWVGDRRWDLHFDDRVEIKLPEEGPADAWRRLGALERSSGLLARNYSIIDLRLKDRVVVRKVPNDDRAIDPNERNT